MSPQAGGESRSAQDDAIRRDRDAFLAQMRTIVEQADRPVYTRIIDDLIGWSRAKSDAIELNPRDGDQDIVRFCLVGTPHVFWAAYPRPTEKDAKLMAV